MSLFEALFGKGAKIEPIQPPQPLPVWRQDVAQEMRDPWRNMTEEEMLEREMRRMASASHRMKPLDTTNHLTEMLDPNVFLRKCQSTPSQVTRKAVEAARIALKAASGGDIEVMHDQMRIALNAALEAMK